MIINQNVKIVEVLFIVNFSEKVIRKGFKMEF